MTVKYSDHPAMFRNNPLGFVLSVLLIPVGVGIIILLIWYLKCMATRIEVQDSVIVLETGLLSKDRTELNISGIRSINVYQSFFNRIFGVGRVEIFTAGDDPEITVAGIPDPNEFRNIVKSYQDASR